MRSWWWAVGGIPCDLIRLQIEFQAESLEKINLREVIHQAKIPGFVRDRTKEVASVQPSSTDIDYYSLSYHRISVTDSALSYEVKGNLPEYDASQHSPGILMQLIHSLIFTSEVLVKRWEITAGSIGDIADKYIVQGDHQAFIEYLQLSEPETD